jgi:hypothetical protein
MVAVGDLAKMAVNVALHFVERFPTNVAHLHATCAGHFVAAIGFNKLFVTLRTGPHFGFAESLLDFETSLVATILLEDFLASQGNVSGFAALPTRDESAALDGARENVLHLRYLSLISTLGTHSQVFSKPRPFEVGLCLHFRIFLPGLGWKDLLQHLVRKSRIAATSLAAFDF